MFNFEVLHSHSSSAARCAQLHTPHGVIDTPAFMPVGTKGSVKGLPPRAVKETGTQVILANTYHLILRPGSDVVADVGGLHRFTGWDGPILTDSGGFQIFSLSDLAHIEDEGVRFRSHIDGSTVFLDPGSAIEAQNQLGADIIMAFDHCPKHSCDSKELEGAVTRTIQWAQQCKAAHRRDDQALFGIVQGGLDPDLRQRCAHALLDIGFVGYAIGGLSIGEPRDAMLEVLDHVPGLLPRDKPRYLMGVGMPGDIVEAVRRGVDMFDCVIPTRNGRNAYAFTAQGAVRLRNEQHKRSQLPIEDGCDCYSCTHFSRSYIRHLFNAEEMLGPILASLHNIRFYQRLMQRLRELIKADAVEDIYGQYPVLG